MIWVFFGEDVVEFIKLVFGEDELFLIWFFFVDVFVDVFGCMGDCVDWFEIILFVFVFDDKVLFMLVIVNWIFFLIKFVCFILVLILFLFIRVRIFVLSCWRVICFCWRFVFCWFSLIVCLVNCVIFLVIRILIVDEIIWVVEDLWFLCCFCFLESFLVILVFKIYRKFNLDFIYYLLIVDLF